MNSLEIREMLMQMGDNTPCPVCQEKIPTTAIEVVETNGSFCRINFHCPQCKEEFSGHAQIKKVPPEEMKALNISTIVAGESESLSEEISENEVQGVHSILENDISFIDLFSKKLPPQKG